MMPSCPVCGSTSWVVAATPDGISRCPNCGNAERPKSEVAPNPTPAPAPVRPQVPIEVSKQSPKRQPTNSNDTLSQWQFLLLSPSKLKLQTDILERPMSQLLLWAVLATVMGFGIQLLWATAMTEGDFHLQLTKWTLTPFALLITILLSTLWLQVGLWATGLFSRTDHLKTMKAVTLSCVGNFWAMIPVAGPLLALWSHLAILFASLKATYQMGRGRIVLALTLPLFFLGLAIGCLVAFASGVALVAAVVAKNLVLMSLLP